MAGGPFKFTVTSPYMLARTLLDEHYRDFAELTLAIADVLAAQVADLTCACVQVDEANIPGNPADAPLAAEAINRVLDAVARARRPCISASATTAGRRFRRRLDGADLRFSTRCTPITWCSNWRTGPRPISMRCAI